MLRPPLEVMTGPTPGFFELDGVERIRSQIEGRFPLAPAYLLAGMRPTALEMGMVEFVMPSACALDDTDEIDLAAFAYFADAPMALALVSKIERHVVMRSIVLRLNYPPVERPSIGNLVARGTITAASARAGTAAISIQGHDGIELAMVSIAQTAAALALAKHPHRLREFGYHFVRGVAPDRKPVRARASFRHLGRAMAVVDVEVTNADSNPVGFGRATATV